MLPRLRVKRTRSPLAEASKISLPALPLKSIVSVPSWPSTVSLPSPGSHWKMSSPAPRKRGVVALLAVDEVVAVAAEQQVGAVAAEDRVVAGAAVDGDLDQRRQVAGGARSVSSPPFMLTTRFSVVPMSRRERRRVEAVEAHARAVGGDGEHLGAVAAVDFDGVGAGAAFDEIGVVAGIPDHAVVAGLAEHLVVGVAAGQRVVAGAAEQEVEAALAEQRVVAALAEQQVAAGAAGQRVVAGAAEQVGARQRAVALVERDGCRCRPGRRPGSGWCWRPSACRRGRRTAPPLTRMRAGGVAADDDRVVGGVAEHAQHARAGDERSR